MSWINSDKYDESKEETVLQGFVSMSKQAYICNDAYLAASAGG